MNRQQRWLVLILLLGLTLSAAAWVSQEEEVAEPVAPAQPAAAQDESARRAGRARESVADLQLDRLRRAPREEEDSAADLFAAKSWYVPPPPPKLMPPPPPAAPPLPFSYMGKLIEDGQLTVFLTRQERNYVVKAGDTLDGTYKVEAVSARVMTLTYLPLNIKQTLMIGSE